MKFAKEFNILKYIIENSNKILLVAHNRPDGDTVGSVSALHKYLRLLGKQPDIACFDSLPEYLENLVLEKFNHPSTLNLNSYDAVIACDSVERGYEKIRPQLSENQVTVLIDHHPDINLDGDVKIIDASYSSVCEIIYDFLNFTKARITPRIATYLMIGILSDTGNFQHSNTTIKVMTAASDLIKKGASLAKITSSTFSNKKISTLKLWGRAFEKAKINHKNKMIASVLTYRDIEECQASNKDIGQVASILNTVPGTSFSLILSQEENGSIKGSLRSEKYKGIDVSAIAHQFGGGGHKLASGFEIKGKIIETADGWKIV